MELVDFDQLWDYGNPSETEERFKEILSQPDIGSNPGYQAELLTQIARTHSLRRNFDQANAILNEAEEMPSAANGRPRIRLLLERGRTLNSAGNADAARPFFEDAWTLALATGEDALAVDAAHMVAITEQGTEALRWNLLALGLAESSPEPRAQKWRKSLHNNLGWTYFEMGQTEAALAHFEKSRHYAEEARDIQSERIARWCIGKSLRTLGRLEDALAMQMQLIEESGDPAGFRSEEAGECLLAMGRGEAARPYFETAYELLSQDAWLVKSEPERLSRIRLLMSE